MRTSRIARGLAVTAGFAVLGACDGSEVANDSARLAADTVPVSTTTATAGPLPAVTSADGDLMMDALDFRITDENFALFVRASEALSFLRARDINVRSMLEQAGTGADPTTSSLLERFEQHPQVSQAITDAGITVKDYYVMAIAVANAQRHAANPAGALSTPVGQGNAEWVARHQAEVAKLQTWGAAVAQ